MEKGVLHFSEFSQTWVIHKPRAVDLRFRPITIEPKIYDIIEIIPSQKDFLKMLDPRKYEEKEVDYEMVTVGVGDRRARIVNPNLEPLKLTPSYLNITAEDVKRWHQILVGKGEEAMNEDVKMTIEEGETDKIKKTLKKWAADGFHVRYEEPRAIYSKNGEDVFRVDYDNKKILINYSTVFKITNKDIDLGLYTSEPKIKTKLLYSSIIEALFLPEGFEIEVCLFY